MSETVFVNSLEKLAEYLNQNGVLEVARRDASKRFSPFVNIKLVDMQVEQRELAKRAIQRLCDITSQDQIGLDIIADRAKQLSNQSYASILLNAVNLGATCAGFVIIYNEMQQLSSEISQQIMQLDETVRKSFDIEHKFKLDKVLAEHNDMLDAIRRQQPYSEKEMRGLIDQEHQVIRLLINVLEADVSNDNGWLIVSLFSLMGMLTTALCNFDELYYFNNPQLHGHRNPWHTSHDSWMSIYDDMCSDGFVKRIQDYCVLERGMKTRDADLMYRGMVDQVYDAKERVEDNQALIVAFGSRGALGRFRDLTKKDVANAIRQAYRDAGSEMDDSTVEAACEEALQLADAA